MISLKTNYSPPLCRECVHYRWRHFAIGLCALPRPGLDGNHILPSIVDARTDRCGIKAPRFFKRKKVTA